MDNGNFFSDLVNAVWGFAFDIWFNLFQNIIQAIFGPFINFN